MKKLLFISTLLSITFGTAISQSPQLIWSHLHQLTEDIDDGKCIRQTSDGGYIITGTGAPYGMTTFIDVMLTRTDDSGTVLWTKYYDFGFFEHGMSVDQCDDGGYIIGGIRMYGVYPFVEEPVSDGLLIRTDALGDTLWTRSFDVGGNEYFTSVQQTIDGGYIITGAKNSEACLPPWEVNEETEPDSGMTWLVKTDAAGNISWTQEWIFYSNGNDVIQTSDGGYMITGCVFQSFKGWQSDVLMIKTDETGWNIWEQKIGTDDYEVGFSVKECSDGYIMAGQTKPVAEDYDGLIIKTDLFGNVSWMNTPGGELSDALMSVDISDNGYYFSGSTNGTWWITGVTDFWLLKTDLDGNTSWEEVFDIDVVDVSYSGTSCLEGGYTMIGMASNGYGGDMWMAKLCDGPAGEEEKQIGSEIDLEVYPNPCTDAVRLQFTIHDSRLTSIDLYSIEGRKIRKLANEVHRAGELEIEFDVSDLPDGIYFVRVQAADVTAVRKLVVSR